MAFLDKTLAQIAAKNISGLAHTKNSRDFANETIASGITLSADRIFAQAIPTTPPVSTDGVVSDLVTLVLEKLVGTEVPAFANKTTAYVAKLGGSVPSSLSGKINPLTGVAYIANDRVGNIIPKKYGIGYTPVIKDNGTPVPPLSEADWYLDTFAGVLVQEETLANPDYMFDLGITGTLECYIYIGKTVEERLDEAGSGSSSLGEWQDSIKGFVFTGVTNPLSTSNSPYTLDYYNIPSTASPSVVNGTPVAFTAGDRFVYSGPGSLALFPFYDTLTDTVSTASLLEGSIIEWKDGPTADGWTVTPATTGMFTSVDGNVTSGWGNDNSIWRYTGTANDWVVQRFEATRQVQYELTGIIPTGGELTDPSVKSLVTESQVFATNNIPVTTAPSAFYLYVNGIKVDKDGYSLGTYVDGTIELTFDGTPNDTSFRMDTANGEFEIGEFVKLNYTITGPTAGTLLYRNILTKTLISGSIYEYTYVALPTFVSLEEVIKQTITTVNFEDVNSSNYTTVRLFWQGDVNDYELESSDNVAVEYIILGNI